MTGTASLPVPLSPEGRAGLAALLDDPGRALVALDFDGTLSPIVADPAKARAHPGAVPALREVAAVVGTVAVITGRPAASAVDLGGFEAVPGLIVLGHYGLERWADGTRVTPSRCTPGRRPIRRPPWTGSATRWPAWPRSTGWLSSPAAW
jgi:trehalose 6-phosphate phosphatase